MSPTLLRKGLLYGLTLWAILSLNFGLVHLMPGDPMVHLLGEEGYAASAKSGQTLEALKTEFGLTGSWPEQYVRHLKKTVSGDWGYSFHHGQSVLSVVFQRLQWTLTLLVPAVMLSALIGAWLGAITGWRTHSPLEKAFSGFVLCFYAIPVYCLSLLLLAALAKAITFSHGAMGFSSGTGNSMDWLRSLGLPLGVLILHGAAYNTLLMRSAVRKEMEASYVLTALAKGLSPWRVLLGHILKNTLPPYITVVALHAGFMTGGALLVEVVFSFQGMGTLIYQAVLSRDYPILSGSLTVLCLSVLAANGMAELLYRVLDPRPGENSRGG